MVTLSFRKTALLSHFNNFTLDIGMCVDSSQCGCWGRFVIGFKLMVGCVFGLEFWVGSQGTLIGNVRPLDP